MTEVEWTQLKSRCPPMWIRLQAYKLAELLRTHVALALETGTEPERIFALLERVREAVLTTPPTPPLRNTGDTK